MAKLTIHSTVAEALKNPRAVAYAERMVPGITRHPAIPMVSRFPLEKITRSRRAGITMEKLEAILKEINEE